MQLKVKTWQKKLRNMLLSAIYKRGSWKVKGIGSLIKYNIWKCNWLMTFKIFFVTCIVKLKIDFP